MEKKIYVKPSVYMERFEVSQHVADCAWELVNSTKETCSAQSDPDYLPAGLTLFMDGANGCMVTPDTYGDYCYHDGTQGVNIFAS